MSHRLGKHLHRALLALGVFHLTHLNAAEPPATQPTPEELLAGIVERARGDNEREAAFKARYAFTRERVLEVRDGDDDLKKRDLRRSTNSPTVQPQAPLAALKEGRRPPDAAVARSRAYERRDFQLDRELLDRFRFEVAGQEIIADRPVWRLDFQPAVAAKPAHGIKDRFLARVAGSAWVDVADNEIVRLEARLTAPVNVAGGLVGAVKACRVVLERERTPEGLWFTRRTAWQLEGRQFFQTRKMDSKESLLEVRPAVPGNDVIQDPSRVDI